MQAMILAAGYGTRLIPYSLITPKPLFPVLNKPLLIATIKRLMNSGCSSVIVNCHHLGEQIIDATSSINGVKIQEEPVILGTGGALGLAARSIADEPLLVSNSDIYHDADYKKLYDYHINSGNRVTLLLHHYPRFNSIQGRDGHISRFRLAGKSTELFAYTGIQVINPELLEVLQPDMFSCIIEHYEALIETGVRIGYYLDTDVQWYDIGTPGDYLGLHNDLLTGKTHIWQELNRDTDSSFVIHPNANCNPGCTFEDWVSIGQAEIGSGSVVSRSVVWDGARVDPDECIADRILTP